MRTFGFEVVLFRIGTANFIWHRDGKLLNLPLQIVKVVDVHREKYVDDSSFVRSFLKFSRISAVKRTPNERSAKRLSVDVDQQIIEKYLNVRVFWVRLDAVKRITIKITGPYVIIMGTTMGIFICNRENRAGRTFNLFAVETGKARLFFYLQSSHNQTLWNWIVDQKISAGTWFVSGQIAYFDVSLIINGQEISSYSVYFTWIARLNEQT